MIIVALGANLPAGKAAPAETLRAALRLMPQMGIKPICVSRFYQNPAIAAQAQPDYINAVARVRAVMPPAALLARLHALEARFGRQRRMVNEPRPLDLDLIDYHGACTARPVCLPHPRAHLRGFVLYPLQEIAPGWRHPILRCGIDRLIKSLPCGRGLIRKQAKENPYGTADS